MRVGVVGAGQLARMMGEVAAAVGVRLTVLAGSPDDPATQTCDEVIVGDAADATALDALADAVDVITFDHELVDLGLIASLERRGVAVRPGARALTLAVDKAAQRRALLAAGVAVPRFAVATHSREPDLVALLDEVDEVVVKLARGGYDGRGVWFPDDRAEAVALVDELGAEVVVEERLDLVGEAAQVVVRGLDGSLVHYPLVSTVQDDGMCTEVAFPADVAPRVVADAAALGERLAAVSGVVGVMAVELFVTRAGLVVNELAMRPHNTGHWTIEGCATSQFANHLLAVSGRALGPVDVLTRAAVMVNLVGADTPSSPEAARAVAQVHVHDYGKSWRPGRKLGHVTALDDDPHRAHVRAWDSARAYGTRYREA